MRGRGTSTASRPSSSTGSNTRDGRPVAPQLSQGQPHLAVGRQLEPLLCHGTWTSTWLNRFRNSV